MGKAIEVGNLLQRIEEQKLLGTPENHYLLGYVDGIAEGKRLERRSLRKELKECFDRPTLEMVVGAIKGAMWQYHKQANRSKRGWRKA